MAEVHQLPDGFVLVRLDQLAATVMRHLEVTRESKVCAVEMREPCGDMFEAMDVVDHWTQRQIARTGEGDNVSVRAVLIRVPRRCRDGLSGCLVRVDAIPFERDLGWVVTNNDVVAGQHEDRNRLEAKTFSAA